jgi:hypothetical protein
LLLAEPAVQPLQAAVGVRAVVPKLLREQAAAEVLLEPAEAEQ